MSESPIPAQHLGMRLIEAGWAQGSLIDAEALLASPPIIGGTALCVALKKMLPTGNLVVASQTCDINASPNKEPGIEALVCIAKSPKEVGIFENSARQFVVDPTRGLTAMAAQRVLIDKLALEPISSSAWPSDDDRRQRFARWLGDRFRRSEFPDEVIEGFCSPLHNLLVDDRKKDGANWHAFLNSIIQVRLRCIQNQVGGPIDVAIRVIRDPQATAPDVRRAIGFTDDISAAFKTDKLRLVSREVMRPDQMSLAEAWVFKPVYLDYLSYDGNELIDSFPGSPD